MAANFCEACGQRLSPSARFCGGCGAAVGGGGGAGSGRESATSPAHASTGRPAGSGGPGADEPGGAARGGSAPEETVLEFRSLIVTSVLRLLLCVLTLGIAWIVLRIRQGGLAYLVTTQRLEIRSGLFSIRRRSVDLFRIQDIEVTEPFFLRLRGAGQIRILAMDKAEPELLLDATPDVRSVHVTLRQLVQQERRRMNVRLIEDS